MTAETIEYVRAVFPEAEWTQPALEAAALFDQPAAETAGVEYKFGGFHKPFQHQITAFQKSCEREAFALLMEMGTAKTRVIIDTAYHLYETGRITGVLVIAPNTVKATWEEEIRLHMPERFDEPTIAIWRSARREPPIPRGRELTWQIMNIEALSTQRGTNYAGKFLRAHKAMMVIDESTRIKTPSRKRTRAAIKLGKLAKYRRIMTGAPVTTSPLDIYAQFKFLDPSILGFNSFYAFRNRYTIMGGWKGREVLGYVDIDDLARRIAPHSYRVLKSECFDLPAKIYEKRIVQLTKQQRQYYDDMARDMLVEFPEQGRLSATIVLTQMLRLQQIVGGFTPIDGQDNVIAIPGGNPKLNELRDVIDETDGKVLVWSRFRAETAMIADALRQTYGDESVTEFHGDIKERDRAGIVRRFQDPDSPLRFFIGQIRTGGIGLTLTAARTVVYFSNSFSLEDRLQSEDRAHRAGLKHAVTYIDLLAEKTLDVKEVITSLREKRQLASAVTRDELKEWI